MSLFKAPHQRVDNPQCLVFVPVAQNDINVTTLQLASSISSHNGHLKTRVNLACVLQYDGSNGFNFVPRDFE